jgi:hypothetical protein
MTLQGGFQSEMNRREAAQILGVRESAAEVSRSMCNLMPSSATCWAAGHDLACIRSSMGLSRVLPPCTRYVASGNAVDTAPKRLSIGHRTASRMRTGS